MSITTDTPDRTRDGSDTPATGIYELELPHSHVGGMLTTPVPDELRRMGVTSQEVDVLKLLGGGLTNAAIAERLHVSPGTVKGYVSQLLTKTATANGAGLTRVAAHHHLSDHLDG